MLRILFLIVILFFKSSIQAQQKVVFETRDKFKNKEEYRIPVLVACKFMNGEKKRLLLIQIKGDSLIFQKPTYPTRIYDCKYTALKSIKMNVAREGRIKTLVIISMMGFGTSFAFLANSLNQMYSRDVSVETVYVELPLVLNFFTSSLVLENLLPDSYDPLDWKMYAK